MGKCCCFHSTASASLILPMWYGKGCIWSPPTEGAAFPRPQVNLAPTVLFRMGLLWPISPEASMCLKADSWWPSQCFLLGQSVNLGCNSCIWSTPHPDPVIQSDGDQETDFQVLQVHACNLNVQLISFFKCSYCAGWWTVWTNLVFVTLFPGPEMPKVFPARCGKLDFLMRKAF